MKANHKIRLRTLGVLPKLIIVLFSCLLSSYSYGNDFLIAHTSDSTCWPPTDSIFTFDSIPDSTVNAILQSHNTTYYFRTSPNLTGNFYNQVSIQCTGDINSLKTALEQSGKFSDVELISSGLATGPKSNDPWTDHVNSNWPGFKDDWNWDQVKTYCAWQTTTGSSSVKVTVIDQDLDNSHYDIDMSSTKTKYKLYGDKPSFSDDRESHMTSVVGFLAATKDNNKGIVGIAPGINLDLREVEGPTFIARAVDDAVEDGSKIISLSWNGTTLSKAVVENYVENKGVTFIIAAGNQAGTQYHQDLWDIPGVIIVSSSTKPSIPGTIGDFYSSHSYYPGVDLLAPGHLLRSIKRDDGFSSMKTNNGTSFAAPTVAGVVALMKSVAPGLDPATIECIIKSSTKFAANTLPGYPWYGQVGTGILDAEEAVLNAQEWSQTATSLVVNSNTTITTDQDFQEIVIKPGATLDIRNCNITVRSSGKILVEENAKLILDNVHIRENHRVCSVNWDGIQVSGPASGTSMFPYSTSLHGKVEIINNSTIENAKKGIELGSSDGSISNGGVFQVSDAIFKNCRFGIFHNGFIDPTTTYQNSNPSYVEETAFICDQPINGYNGEGVNTHIWLFNVNGINIISSEFHNYVPDGSLNLVVGGALRGRGIGTWDAAFKVRRSLSGLACTPTGSRNKFSGLEIGIESGFTNTNTGFDEFCIHILESDFTNNRMDINMLNDSYTFLWNNSHNWNSSYTSGGTFLPTTVTIGNSFKGSVAPKRIDGNFNFDIDDNSIFIGNEHFNEFGPKSIIHSINPPDVEVIGAYSNGNSFTSSYANTNTVAEFFDNDPNTINKLSFSCNRYGKNLNKAMLANQSSTDIDLSAFTFDPFGVAMNNSTLKRPSDNLFETCLKTINPLIPNMSIDGNTSNAFMKPEHFFISSTNQVIIGSKTYDLQPDVACLDNVHSLAFRDLSTFAKASFEDQNEFCAQPTFINTQLAYCTGDDQIPLTLDDPEGWWDFQITDPGNNEGTIIPESSSEFDELFSSYNIQESDLLNQDLSVKQTLILLNEDDSDPYRQEHANYLLSQFYGSRYERTRNVSFESESNQNVLSNKHVDIYTSLDGIVKTSPNPFDEKITISSEYTIKSIAIFNILGELIYSAIPESLDLEQLEINSVEFKPGAYTCIVEDSNGVHSIKIVKID